ncbi:SERTA domain-containing protein 4 [Trachemys scripta elegans]|uniref:SERTA domain-containing protein 4 n=1 Tax=Trachemys scripta elegans TaxID=31138 RepID=UPI0015536A50|nr:SERTA domain-containing protein 4 [Trachemys scripta elegans]
MDDKFRHNSIVITGVLPSSTKDELIPRNSQPSLSLCKEEILPELLKSSQKDTLQIDSASQADPIRVLTNTLTTSKVAYFKRKYAEEEDLHQDYQGYFPKHLILPEDRTCILKLSLQKLRFLEDPETYLRRSVLINNLLRKIHLETDRESYEYFKETPCYRTAYSDTRKRLKFMVQECCSESLYYEELHSYHIVPYSTENSIYGMGYTSGHLEKNSQLLIYKMN